VFQEYNKLICFTTPGLGSSLHHLGIDIGLFIWINICMRKHHLNLQPYGSLMLGGKKYSINLKMTNVEHVRLRIWVMKKWAPTKKLNSETQIHFYCFPDYLQSDIFDLISSKMPRTMNKLYNTHFSFKQCNRMLQISGSRWNDKIDNYKSQKDLNPKPFPTFRDWIDSSTSVGKPSISISS